MRSILVYDSQNGNDAYPASNFTTFNIGQTVPEYLEMGTIQADGGDTFGVSTIQFDTHEELIWMGNEGVSSMFIVQWRQMDAWNRLFVKNDGKSLELQ